MITFVKPDGRELQVNENSASYAESIGWKRKDANTDDIEEYRQLYREALGKEPHHKMGIPKMIEAIEKAQDNGDSSTSSERGA